MTTTRPTRVTAPATMAYTRIEVPDIDTSVAWYGYHVGLEARYRGAGDSVYLPQRAAHPRDRARPAPGHAESWTTAIGFTVPDEAALHDLHTRCVAAGASPRPSRTP